MPKGLKSKAHLFAETLTLTAECRCGRQFEGKAKITEKLFLLHRKKCPMGGNGHCFEAETDVTVGERGSRGNYLLRNDKRKEKIRRVAEPFMSYGPQGYSVP
jgi:hypothetical protein